tara:strand:- start:1920 stop:2078 length:159 start_codon:yes stop_codon:yes gene_type:complete
MTLIEINERRELETMMLLIEWEYEQAELKEYKPKKFEAYLLEKLAEIRLSKG